MHVIHRSAVAQCWLGLEHRDGAQVRHNAAVVSSLYEKKLQVKQILCFCFSL